MNNAKDIHLGSLIRQGVKEREIKNTRIFNFFKCSDYEIEQMYESKSLDTEVLLRWSKLLEYDFFRLYSQHLILYSPQGSKNRSKAGKKLTGLPQFKKSIYNREVIDFILELMDKKRKTSLRL